MPFCPGKSGHCLAAESGEKVEEQEKRSERKTEMGRKEEEEEEDWNNGEKLTK